MELRQLTYLSAVVRCGGFTRAAEELHVAQPAVSAQIRRLERELGVELLRRTTRSVVLTAAGGQVLAHVEAALAQVEQIRSEAQAHRSVERGHVRVGVTPVTGGLDVVSTLGRFRARYRGVTLSLRTGLAGALLDDLRGGHLDVVVAPSHGEPDAALSAVPVGSERLVVITPPGDTRQLGSVADIAADTFVCLPAGSGLRRLLDESLARVGATATVEFETQTPASIRELVAAALGTAVVAESAVRGPGPVVTVHQLPDLPDHPPVCVFSAREGGGAATRRFVSELIAGVR